MKVRENDGDPRIFAVLVALLALFGGLLPLGRHVPVLLFAGGLPAMLLQRSKGGFGLDHGVCSLFRTNLLQDLGALMPMLGSANAFVAELT